MSSVIVCGDLHLRDDGSWSPLAVESLVGLLEQLAQEAELVVINGDLFDLDRGRFPCAQRYEFERSRHRWCALEEAIARLSIRVTAGNHDHALRGEIMGGHRVCEALELSVDGVRVRIEHGERFDAWVKRVRGFTSFVTWLSAWVDRPPLRPVYRLMRWVERATTQDERGGIEKRAMRWLHSQERCDVLVLGHTHRRTRWDEDRRTLLNPGDGMGGRVRFLRVGGDGAGVRFGDGDGRGPLRYECKARLDERPQSGVRAGICEIQE